MFLFKYFFFNTFTYFQSDEDKQLQDELALCVEKLVVSLLSQNFVFDEICLINKSLF